MSVKMRAHHAQPIKSTAYRQRDIHDALRAWGAMDTVIAQLTAELRGLKIQADALYLALPSSSIANRTHASVPSDPTGRTIAEAEETLDIFSAAYAKTAAQLRALLARKQEITQAVQALAPRMQRVVQYRYQQQRKWAWIAEKERRSAQHLQRTLRQALVELADKVPFAAQNEIGGDG